MDSSKIENINFSPTRNNLCFHKYSYGIRQRETTHVKDGMGNEWKRLPDWSCLIFLCNKQQQGEK